MKRSTEREDSSQLVRIVPLIALAPEKSPFFSYRSHTDIPRGSVVPISFGPKTVRGVVWGKESQKATPSRKPIRYKTVGKLLAQAFLSEETLLFAERISQTNSIALGAILLKFLPKTFPKDAGDGAAHPKKIQVSWQKIATKKTSLPLTGGQRKAAADILDSQHPYTLLFGPSASGKTRVHFECIRKLLEKGGQALVIIPDRSLLLQEETRYAHILDRKSVAVFHSGMKPSERDETVRQVQSGAVRIILGTRSAIFLPFRALGLIIVEDAGAPAYRKQGPALPDNAHQSAQTLASAHHAICLFSASAPSFNLLFTARKSGALVTLPALSDRSLSLQTINLRLERWKKKLSPVSEELGNAIAATVARKEQALLFVSREGMNSFSVCAECKAVFRCATCGKPFSYRAEGDYVCARCKQNAGTTPACPICGSLAFQHLGAGTERVERDLARRFPHISTIRYDRKNATKKTTLSHLQEFLAGTRDVLITTERGIRGWDLPRLSLIGIIDADALLGSQSWDADERAFQNMLSAIGRTARNSGGESTSGSVFIQTFHPENPIFSLLAAENLEGFFQTIEDERRLLLYPPFGIITKLTCRLASKIKLSQETDRVYEALQRHAEKSGRTLRISPPSPIRQVIPTSKSRLFQRHILVRQSISSTKDSASLEDFIVSLPREWTRTNE